MLGVGVEVLKDKEKGESKKNQTPKGKRHPHWVTGLPKTQTPGRRKTDKTRNAKEGAHPKSTATATPKPSIV